MPTPREYIARDGTRTWRVRFRDPDGRNSSITFRTRAAANTFASDVQHHGAAHALEALDAREHAAPTLDDVADQFLTWKATRVRSDRTVADYRRDYGRWIHPTFGHKPANHVTTPEVQAWVDAMHAGTLTPGGGGRPRPAAPKSIADRHALLHAIYDWAASPSRGIVTTNPTIGTDLPRKSRPAPKGLRPAEWQALHAALRQIDHDAADLAAFLLGSGWRWSEATALTTFGVEDDGTTMHVTMSQVARRNAAGQTVIVQDAKSAAAFRRILLDPDTAAIVRRRVTTARPGDLVFTNQRGGRWSYSNFTDRAWKPARTAANINPNATPHWLRHTHVALMVTAGARLPELQSRIGHASITTTIGVYGRMVTDVDSDALSGFAALRDAGSTPAIGSQ